jgi:hypothetical protein
LAGAHHLGELDLGDALLHSLGLEACAECQLELDISSLLRGEVEEAVSGADCPS